MEAKFELENISLRTITSTSRTATGRFSFTTDGEAPYENLSGQLEVRALVMDGEDIVERLHQALHRLILALEPATKR